MQYIKLNDIEAKKATQPEPFTVRRKLTWPVMARDEKPHVHGFTCKMYSLSDLDYLREIISVPQVIKELIVAPLGTIGDKLWVKETYIVSTKVLKSGARDTVIYRADFIEFRTAHKWLSPQAMPIRFSRSVVRIENIEIEQKKKDLFNWVYCLKRVSDEV